MGRPIAIIFRSAAGLWALAGDSAVAVICAATAVLFGLIPK